eukprot:1137967-Pelagomonas_calceolata.AAC.2
MWKLGKKGIKSASGSWAKVWNAHTTQSNCNRKEHVSRQHTHTYHTYLNHPTIYKTRPSSSGHEA